VNQQQLTWNDEEKNGLLAKIQILSVGQEQDGVLALATMPIDGGPARILWSPHASVYPSDLSPDGSRLLALLGRGEEREREAWIVPLGGREPYRLSSLEVHSAAWAPDGKQIACATGNEIDLVAADSVSVRKIGSFGAIPDALHWSADGRRLRFLLTDATTEKQFYWELTSTDGMATVTLRALPSPLEKYEQWTQSTQKDAYSFSAPTGTPGDFAVWLVQYGAGWLTSHPQFTQLPLHLKDTHGMVYDRASQRLFILSSPPQRNSSIRFNPKTGEFTEMPPKMLGVYLDYSRDGLYVTYTSPQGEALWISRADGSSARQITFPPEDVQLPRWSPDGKQIAYMAKKSSSVPWRIFLYRLDTGQMREASEGNDNQGAPTWSPNGRFLVYGGLLCQATHSCAIHRIDLATGKVWTLPGSEDLFTARWSPDGRFIAALQQQRRQLYLYNVATQRWRKLADEINGADMCWSADSTEIYMDTLGSSASILRIHAADGHRETVVDLHKQDIVALSNANDLGFTLAPDRLIILHRRKNAAEIYAYNLIEK
jgi:Tol biopolymer transport system component